MTPDLAGRVHRVWCGGCWQNPGAECGPGWDHLDRYLRACRRGFITHAELQRAVHASTLLPGGGQAVRFSDRPAG